MIGPLGLRPILLWIVLGCCHLPAQTPFDVTWTRGVCENCKTSGWLDTIQFVSQKEAWARGCNHQGLEISQISCSIAHTVDGGRTWRELSQVWQYPGANGRSDFGWYPNFSFIDPHQGWIAWQTAVGGGFLHTSDGGAHWEKLPSGFAETMNLTFLDSRTGLATGRNLGDNDIVRRTTDGGHHWTKVETQPIGLIDRILFIDARTGWMIGDAQKSHGILVSRTSDAGEHWSAPAVIHVDQGCRFPSLGAIEVNDTAFQDANRGWLLEHLDGDSDCPSDAVYRTIDGGKTWERVASPGGAGNPPLLLIKFVDREMGFAFFESGDQHLWSRDGGVHWQKFRLPAVGAAHSVPTVHDCRALNGDLFCSASRWSYLDSAPERGSENDFYVLRIHPQGAARAGLVGMMNDAIPIN